MAGMDKSQGKLIFPPRFVPYLEKHRIFELFHELAELLVQEMPKDHVRFLKEMLPCAAKRRDKPRIVFWTHPTFDREGFAREIAGCLDILEITRFHLEEKEKERMAELARRDEVKCPEAEEDEQSFICFPEYFGEYHFPKIGDRRLLAESQTSMIFVGEADVEEDAGEEKEEEEQEQEQEEIPEKEEKEFDRDPCKGFRVCPCKRKQLPEKEIEKDETDMEGEYDENELTGESSVMRTSNYGSDDEKKSLDEKPFSDAEIYSAEAPCKCVVQDEFSIDYGVLGKCEYAEKGWILVDFPKDAEEAEQLCAKGAIPTHAMHLIANTEDEKTRQYKYMSRDWENVYQSIPVMDIHVNGRSNAELARDICKLLRIMPHRHPPMLPRIVLIGCRGSGATTQAKMLSRKYKMIHVEFQEAFAQVLLQDDSLCEKYKLQKFTRPDPELEAAILERILLTPPCRKRGWVLTGYPTTIDQMRMLDIIVTPPNRIIFIEVPPKECFIRLYYRKTDWTDGTEYKLPHIEPFGLEMRNAAGINPDVAKRLLPHPRDDKRQIIHDIEEFFEEKEMIMRYCGRTAAYVNGNKSIDTVFELIEQVIINPAPAESARDPLAVNYGIREAYQRLKSIRMEGGVTGNNLLKNPPDSTIKF